MIFKVTVGYPSDSRLFCINLLQVTGPLEWSSG